MFAGPQLGRPDNVFASWFSLSGGGFGEDYAVSVAWDPPPKTSANLITGYKLAWGTDSPPNSNRSKISIMYPNYTFLTNTTGVLYISVWAYSNGFDGPAAVTSE